MFFGQNVREHKVTVSSSIVLVIGARFPSSIKISCQNSLSLSFRSAPELRKLIQRRRPIDLSCHRRITRGVHLSCCCTIIRDIHLSCNRRVTRDIHLSCYCRILRDIEYSWAHHQHVSFWNACRSVLLSQMQILECKLNSSSVSVCLFFFASDKALCPFSV